MMRLPWFRHHAPGTLSEAARILADEGPNSMLIAGGTDLLPNMKRRQQVPATLVGLRRVDEIRHIANGDGLTIGAGVTLTDLVRDGRDILLARCRSCDHDPRRAVGGRQLQESRVDRPIVVIEAAANQQQGAVVDRMRSRWPATWRLAASRAEQGDGCQKRH
jgi:hypothetical protein